MTEKPEVHFEEAEQQKSVILTSTAAACLLSIWILRDVPLLMTLIVILCIFLMTGDRYQWVYIWKKTFWRDMTSFL
ncbi:jg19221 [Pararge aegeria aegeria]|uniref:Jg19221 protein n=1 Tax=Pararge aegeria aegeria TaxID=348720 RepID=A0A8S4QHM3_9NEOP|nr:jg19221 [Pararge aegeria aegeria]